MALFWQIVSLLSVWLLYGLAASFFVKNVNKRDYLLLISSGLIGGLLGGRIGNILDVPENIWWPIKGYGFANQGVCGRIVGEKQRSVGFPRNPGG